LHNFDLSVRFVSVLSKGSPLPFEQKELSPDGRPIIGLFILNRFIERDMRKKG
jgi:hypothetical protein